MNKPFALSLLLISFSISLFGQSKTEDFELGSPGPKVQNSNYNSITLLDSRKDTSSLGIVQLGAFNRKARVIPKTPFSRQLKILVDSLTDPTASSGRLLLQLKQFNFAEVTGSFTERGYFHFRANLYSDSNGQYQKIASIDTLVVNKSGMDVTKAMLRHGGELVVSFIAGNLSKRPSDAYYFSMNDVMNIDSIEKAAIKLYNTETYADGLYLTYNTFKEQAPDKQITAQVKNGDIIKPRTTDSSGKSIKVKPGSVYALVYQGQPYISTDYGFYPLEKRGSDFFFIGKAKVTANTSDVLVASMMFGIMGSLLASNAQATFEMQIDHVSGGFIHLREIKMPSDNN